MGIFRKGPRGGEDAPAPAAPLVSAAAVRQTAQQHERMNYLQQMKVRIHQQLVSRLDLQNLRTLPAATVREEVRVLVKEVCHSERGLVSTAHPERLMDDV